MTGRMIGGLALTLALAGCGAERRSAIEAEIAGDAAHGTATLTCRAATGGMCHAVLLGDGTSRTLDVAPGASAAIGGLAAGTRVCIGVTAPDPATCRATDLSDGRQIVRHERRVRD